jgi:hypothetical protein
MPTSSREPTTVPASARQEIRLAVVLNSGPPPAAPPTAAPTGSAPETTPAAAHEPPASGERSPVAGGAQS